jgi:transposase
MHVKRTVRRRGDKEYTYLSLVEAIRVNGKSTQRVLLRLGEVGELERTGQLDRIVAALRSYTEREWLAVDELEGKGAPSFGALAAVSSYFDRLGLRGHFADIGAKRGSKHLEDTVLVMVANRLCDPGSKRRTIYEWLDTVALPEGVSTPLLDQCYRGLDALAEVKEATEELLYSRLTDLTNLDLRLALYDLTSTYFETQGNGGASFPSRAYGYSRDKRGGRPQVVIGLLVTGNGIPIAHYVFSGNTSDSSTLPTVMADYQQRFAIGKIALVADRGLISEKNLAEVHEAGFDHVMATRLHNDDDVRGVLEIAEASEKKNWVEVGDEVCALEVVRDEQRYVVVDSPERRARDDYRRQELLTRTESKLVELADRVSAGRLSDPAKIGVAADRILRDSGVGRCFTTTIREGSFTWNHDQRALHYDEQLLAGRFVLSTSLDTTTASTADVVRHYKMLCLVEHRFWVMKDFLGLRPVFHRLEARVRAHIAVCVMAAVIEAVMAEDLARAHVMDPEIADQVMTPRRALVELSHIRKHRLEEAKHRIELVDRPTALQRAILDAMAVDTSSWTRAAIL